MTAENGSVDPPDVRDGGGRELAILPPKIVVTEHGRREVEVGGEVTGRGVEVREPSKDTDRDRRRYVHRGAGGGKQKSRLRVLQRLLR